jgi:hypothetical protein
VGGESASLAPDEPIPDGWRFRLETLQRGYANVTFAPGRRFRFDHFGVCTAEFDEVVARADEAGWSVRDPAGRRPFAMTPWGFRVEIHRDGSEVERSLGSREAARIESIRLVVADADEVAAGLEAVLGDVPGLTVEAGDVERASVPRFVLAGERFDPPREVNVEALATGRARRSDP